MNTTTTCPATEELRQLLSGSLSATRQVECTDHVESCPYCQTKLEELATGGTNLCRLVERAEASFPTANSAYWKVVESLESDPARLETYVPPAPRRNAETPPGTRRGEVLLDFLEPASDSAYLGRLAHFDVMRVLGRGGMGVVLEAFDSHLQRHVALKVLDPEFAEDETAKQRFCREARAAASISHENVVAVHQVERSADGQVPYLVMQLVSGESLEQRLARERTLPLREIVRIGMQAAHGLAAAHAQGLIHRDIKPGNILLEPPSDRVKITDFGLARAAEDVRLTRTGYVSGTPLYMAPEQALGDEPDHRSDLFSLGAILYEMCAGQPPFDSNSALGVMKQITDAKHRPLRELNPAIPEWLSYTIDRLLAKRPADRIQTAAQLAELLEFQWALMKASSEDVPEVCEIEERRRVVRSRWLAVAVGVTTLAAGLIGGRYLANRNGTAAPGQGAVMFSAGAALPGGAGAATPPSKPSPEPFAVLSANGGAIWSVAFNRTSDTVAMAVEDGSVRLWDLPSKSVKATLPAHRGTIWQTRFAEQGDLIATSGDDGLIKLWKGQPEPVQIFKHPNAVRGLAFARDGKTLFAGDREGGLRVWSLDADDPIAEAQQPGAVYAVALSPNEETLATAGSDKVVRLWNAKTLTQKLPLEGHAGPIFSLAFSQDGRRLASAGWDRTVRIWDTGSGQLVRSWEAHNGDVWSVAWSPDGTKLATAGHEGPVKLWDATSGELLETYIGHSVAAHAVAFNHDGTLLASGGRDGAVRIWNVAR